MFERKYLFLIYIFFSAMFSACGGSGATDADDVSSSNSTANGTNLAAEADYSVESYESLPVCNDRKEGQTGYAKGTSKYYVCEDGEWVVTNKPSNPSTSINEDDSSHDDGDVGKGKSSSSRSNSTPDFFGKSSESSGISVGGSDPSTGILTDSRDGQKYKTTKIGDQVWMAENLNYDPGNVSSMGFYAWSGCYGEGGYDNVSQSNLDEAQVAANCSKYGRLYTWEVAMDMALCGFSDDCNNSNEGTQGICPEGWHLPSREEFSMLLESVGSNNEERSANLRALSWGNGQDKFGFSALPAGYYDSHNEKVKNLGSFAYFWSSTENEALSAYYLDIYAYSARVGISTKDDGYSVRCLKDN